MTGAWQGLLMLGASGLRGSAFLLRRLARVLAWGPAWLASAATWAAGWLERQAAAANPSTANRERG